MINCSATVQNYKGAYNASLNLWPTQCPCDQMIAIWAFGNLLAFTVGCQIPHNHSVAMCNVPWQILQKDYVGKTAGKVCQLEMVCHKIQAGHPIWLWGWTFSPSFLENNVLFGGERVKSIEAALLQSRRLDEKGPSRNLSMVLAQGICIMGYLQLISRNERTPSHFWGLAPNAPCCKCFMPKSCLDFTTEFSSAHRGKENYQAQDIPYRNCCTGLEKRSSDHKELSFLSSAHHCSFLLVMERNCLPPFDRQFFHSICLTTHTVT